jgi:hypothetical protein
MTHSVRDEDAELMHQEHNFQVVYKKVQFSAVLIVGHFACFTTISESWLIWAFIWDSRICGVSHSIWTAQSGQANTAFTDSNRYNNHWENVNTKETTQQH